MRLERTLRVARLHTFGGPAAIGWPWAILATSFVVNLAIIAVLDESTRRTYVTGGIASLYIPVGARYIAAMTQWLSFALTLGVSRRRYYRATVLVAVVESVASGAVLLGLLSVEQATGGWGVGLAFFGPPALVHHGVASQLAIYTVPMLAICMLGMVVGIVIKRWGRTGVFSVTIGTIVVVGSVAFLVSWRRQWPAVGEWVATQSPVVFWACWLLAVAAVLAATAYALIRRTTP